VHNSLTSKKSKKFDIFEALIEITSRENKTIDDDIEYLDVMLSSAIELNSRGLEINYEACLSEYKNLITLIIRKIKNKHCI
jgi:hypothetical protein